MGDFLWEVVGGSGRGGIVVRQGEDVQTPMEEDRLGTGALIRILSQVGERLHFAKVSGAGPPQGWVSTRLKDGKDLVVATDTPAPPPKPDRKTTIHSRGELYISERTASYTRPQPPPIEHPMMRVLVLHGGGSNASAIKFQSVRLKTITKAYAEWSFLEGDCEWDEEVLGRHTPREPGEERIKGKGPYRSWYHADFEPPRPRGWSERECHFEGDPDFHFKVLYCGFEAAVEKLRRHVAEQGPFHVVLGFSQAATVITALASALMHEQGAVPWRLTVLANGMWIRDERHAIPEPLDIPCVQVYGRNDHFRAFQSDRLIAAYVKPVVMEHDGNHAWPPPDLDHGEEAYQEIAASMRWHCGLVDA